MVKYLQVDGVDDKLSTPIMVATEFEIVIKPRPQAWEQYINFGGKNINTNGTVTADQFHTDYQTVYVDGNPVTTNTKFITNNVKQTLRGVLKSGISINAAANVHWNGGSSYMEGDIYSLKIWNGVTLQAHYDMSTGTVQDQSGNGRHATLTGGTWLDDGTGGGDTGTDGEITLGLTQQIYSDSSVNLSLSQQIYADISANLELIQSIYRDTEAILGLNQTIYKDDTAVLPLTQAIYRESELGLNLTQEIYAEAESILNLIQEFYEDSQTFITLQLIQQIYKDSSTDLLMTQSIYKDSEIGLPLRQEMYEEKENTLNLLQTVYKDDSAVLSLSQTIYKDSFSTLNTVQQMYTDGEISLPLLIQIRDDLVNLVGVIRLIGKRVLNVPLQGKRELNVTLKGGIDVTAINQNFSMYAGDTKNLVITMPEDLTGCTVKWGLRQRQYSTENFISKTTSDGISINGTEITIKLAPADTQALAGTYFHECEVTDQLGNVSTIFTGMGTISKSGV
jgi:hypothetical protein